MDTNQNENPEPIEEEAAQLPPPVPAVPTPTLGGSVRSLARRVSRIRHIGKISAVVALAAILAAGYTFGAPPSSHTTSRFSASDSQTGPGYSTNKSEGMVALPAATAAPAVPAPALQAADGSTGYAYEGNGGSTGSGDSNALAAVQQSVIIKTGELSLQVNDLDKAIAQAQSTVAAAGGTVASSKRSGDDQYATAYITFRIPAAKWDDTLASLRKVGAKVLSESTGSNDVTMQVVDLNARLDNLQKTEAAFQAVLARASSVPDVLAVQAQLSQTQGQIEQLTAQRDHLNDQAAMSTLTVSMTLPGPTVTTTAAEGWTLSDQIDQAGAALLRIGQGIVTVGVWAVVVVLPVALGLLVLFILFLVFRRISRRGAGTRTGNPEAAA